MNTFSVGGALRFGWETFKKRPWFFVGAALLIMVVSWVVSFIIGMIPQEGAMALLAGIVNMAVSFLIGMGMAAFYLKAHDAPEAVKIEDFWHPKPFWKYVGAMLLTGLVIGVPVAAVALIGIATGPAAPLFVLLAVLLALALIPRVVFAQYFVIDKNYGPIDALKASYAVTKAHWMPLVGFFLACIALTILGVLALFVGVLVATPVTTLAIVHAYRTLTAGAVAPSV